MLGEGFVSRGPSLHTDAKNGHASPVTAPDDQVPLTLWEVLDRLAPARSYWLATVGRSGAPHVAPVWGAVCDGALYHYSERSTAKARNLVGDDRVSINLQDAEEVLIVNGRLEDLGRPQDLSLIHI